MKTELGKMEEIAREIGSLIQQGVSKSDVGFLLMLFNFGEGGHLTYISNAEREDMVLAIKEWLVKEGESIN